MKFIRWFSILLCLAMFTTAGAEGVTLKTVSCFAGADASADAYVELLRDFEKATGNTVIDTSSSSDEAWKMSVLNDFAAGNEPDVLFFFAASADSTPILSRVVSVSEINAAYPEDPLRETEALRESDGQIYAIPVRGYWEGLYVNTDVFEQVGAPLPTNWDNLLEAIRLFQEAGIVPIAVSLSDIPHYLAEFAILACASTEEQMARPKDMTEVPASWYQAMDLIRELYEAHAFADNASATYERATTDMFFEKRAAMQFDGSWLAASMPETSMQTTMVLPIPLYDGSGSASSYIGGVSMGFYLTKKAWNATNRRDAAVALLHALTTQDAQRKLGNSTLRDALLQSAEELTQDRQMVSPLQDAMNQQAREVWLLECIPAVAEGRMTAEECWERVMAYHPFE